jgi:hypothetical protein
VCRMRRAVAFSRRTKSWSRLRCSQIPAHRKAATLYTSRCSFRVQPMGDKRVKDDVIHVQRSRKARLFTLSKGWPRPAVLPNERPYSGMPICKIINWTILDDELEPVILCLTHVDLRSRCSLRKIPFDRLVGADVCAGTTINIGLIVCL